MDLKQVNCHPVNLRDVKNDDRVVIKLANKYICEGLIFIEGKL